MTTPNVTSPNVRLVPKEFPLGADAPKSQTPLAEAALAELLQGGRLGIRDMLKPVDGERAQWPYLETLRAGLELIDAGAAVLETEGHDMVSAAFAGAVERESALRSTPWWYGPAAQPDPEAHPYPVPAPAAEPEHVCEACGVAVTGGEIGPEGLHWLCEDHRSEPDEDGCPACGGTRSERFYVAGLSGPVTCSDDWHDGDAAEPGRPAPVAEPVRDPEEDAPAGRAVEDDAPAPATDPVTVLRALAEKQDAAMEPGATAVIEPAAAETEAMHAQDGSEEGGGSDA